VHVERHYPKTTEDFKTILQVSLPKGDAYLLLDVDRGTEHLNVKPDVALATIAEVGRSPLTNAEGMVVLTLAPHLLQPNKCFSWLASRCGKSEYRLSG